MPFKLSCHHSPENFITIPRENRAAGLSIKHQIVVEQLSELVFKRCSPHYLPVAAGANVRDAVPIEPPDHRASAL